MRRQPFVSSLALVTVLGSGCATSGKSSTEQADTSAPATITYWSTGADEDTAIFQKAADLYKRSHPNVTIKVQTITWDDAYAKLLAAATSRSGPDIISGGLTWAIQFGRRGGMVDLRKYGIDAIQPKAHPSMWKNATSPEGSGRGRPPGCPGWDESAPDVAKQLQSAILGKATPRSALQQAAKIMERNAG